MTDPAHYMVEVAEGVTNDLRQIVAYLIEEGADDVAARLVATFREKIASLEQFPRRGNIPKEIEGMGAGEVRQLITTPYRIFYRIIDERVVITLVADGRREMRVLLEERMLKRGAGDQ